MIHLFSTFGRDNESRTRERRVVFEADVPNFKAELDALKTENDSIKTLLNQQIDLNKQLLAEVREMKSSHNVVDWHKQIAERYTSLVNQNTIPSLTAGIISTPALRNRPCGSCNSSQAILQGYQNALSQQGGCSLRPEIQDLTEAYGVGVRQARTENPQFTYEDRVQNMRRIPEPNHLQLAHAYRQFPWMRGSGRTYMDRRRAPDPFNHSDAMVAMHVRNHGGGAIRTGANSVYLPNPSLQQRGQSQIQNDLSRYHLTRNQARIAPLLEKFGDDERASDEIELAERTFLFSNGDPMKQNFGLNRLENTLKHLQQNDHQEQLTEDLTDDAVLPLHTEYINCAGYRDEQDVRIMPAGRNEFITIRPNKIPIFTISDNEKAIAWGIKVNIQRNHSDGGMPGLARRMDIEFRQPGTFMINGREQEVKGRYIFPAPEDEERGEPRVLEFLNRYGKTVGTIQTNEIQKDETKKLSATVSVTRDEEGKLWVKLYDSNKYTILGKYDSGPDIQTDYRAQITEESEREREEEEQMEMEKQAASDQLDDIESSLGSETPSSVNDAAEAEEDLEEMLNEMDTDPEVPAT